MYFSHACRGQRRREVAHKTGSDRSYTKTTKNACLCGLPWTKTLVCEVRSGTRERLAWLSFPPRLFPTICLSASSGYGCLLVCEAAVMRGCLPVCDMACLAWALWQWLAMNTRSSLTSGWGLEVSWGRYGPAHVPRRYLIYR